ncbi:MAG TPA: hypothetical protein VH914_09995 [Acidimicrobiia bacterium]|nr:hypothetical protein [Acidimicrobiia bacterium]
METEPAGGRVLVPCVGGPCAGYGFLVTRPFPLEVERDRVGVYVLDDLDDEPRYVYVPERP